MLKKVSPESHTIIFAPVRRGVDPWLELRVATTSTRPPRRSLATSS